MASLVDGINKFAFDLYKMMEHTSGTILFSPMSIAASLGMVLSGARGDTAEQMEKVLHFNEMTGSGCPPELGEKDIQGDRLGGPHVQFKALLEAISHHDKNSELTTVNGLFAEEKYTFLEEYIQQIKEMYDADLQKLDFEGNPEEAINQMNTWVEKQTNGEINNFVPDNALDKTTSLAILSATNVKGSWKSQFDENFAKEAPFWINEIQSKNVPMMYKEGEFNVAYIQNPPLQILELPYDGDDMSMMILLPEKKGGRDQIETELTYEKIQEWTSSKNMQKKKLDVYVPKFNLGQTYELNELLKGLGMTDVFTQGKADLSGMSTSKNLFLSKAMHKSYVEVSEEGTEAGTATGVGFSITNDPKEFRADHEFIFYVIEKNSSNILLLGRYN